MPIITRSPCTRSAALAALTNFAPHAGRRYADTRNADDGPGRTNVSQLSPYLHAGLISEREVIEAVYSEHSSQEAYKFASEVFWRIYFKGYLEQRPSIWRSYCDERGAALARVDANAGLAKGYREACEGRTRIEAFDIWARELVETGYLHNHARMWFASIWIYTLRLPWELGADFFLRHLIDGDAASNTLNWRWVGGLHTKGKTYLARASNIARYTADHPEGPLSAEGLADQAEPLDEPGDHRREALDLPPKPIDLPDRYALILHDEGASHVPLHLAHPPALVIGAACPEARSPGGTGSHAAEFARTAVESGVADAAAAFRCETTTWDAKDTDLENLLEQADLHHIAIPYLCTGWTRDTLWPRIAPLADDGRVTQIVSDLDRATWPHAKAGFYGVRKRMDGVLRECGVAGAG